MSSAARPLLVATAGGHLTQLMALCERMSLDVDSALWVTMPTAQSRSALADRDVLWAPYGAPRDLRALTHHAALAVRTVAREKFSSVVSTGANLAPPFLAAARARGIPAHFIESATRTSGPSFAGRLLERIPGVHLYSQYESWAAGRWGYGGSLFDGYTTEERTTEPVIRRALVSVGSARGFPFPAMLEAARHALPADCEITWQVGDANVSGLPGRVVRDLPADEMQAELSGADVVLCHAGTGSAIAALRAGKCPVLVPRRAAAGEHVDDHQQQIADMLAERKLAVVRPPDELTRHDLLEAGARAVVAHANVPFRLAA